MTWNRNFLKYATPGLCLLLITGEPLAAQGAGESLAIARENHTQTSGDETTAQGNKDTGILAGTVLDRELGARISGALIEVGDTGMQVVSDVNGNFTLRGIPWGSYRIEVSHPRFQTTRIGGVELQSNDPVELDIGLKAKTENLESLEAFVVSFEDVQSGDLMLLEDRQRSTSLSDAIGEDSFSKFGLGDAAEAMTKVTGVSVVDGKYMVIRGLGDRYTNTLLNGFGVASADPDRRAVQMDQFPSDALESIVTSKSFTPDQPGAFSGGSVNMKTKSFPEQFFLKVGSSVSVNTNVFGERVMEIPKSGDLWKGTDGGYRGLPADFPDEINPGLTASLARLRARQGDFGPAEELDAFSNAFQNDLFYPTEADGGMNYGFNISTGDQIFLDADRSLGYILSATWDRSSSHYTEGITGRYAQGSVDITSPNFVDLNRLFSPEVENFNFYPFIEAGQVPPGGEPAYGVTSTSQMVNWGTFAQLAYKFNSRNEVVARVFHNQNAEDSITRGIGEAVRSDSGGEFREGYNQLFTERGITSVQLEGTSQVDLQAGLLTVDWRLGHSISTQDQPDYRSLELKYSYVLSSYDPSGTFNNRYFRSLEEDNTELGLDLTFEVSKWSDADSKLLFKFGGLYSTGDRMNQEREFQINFGNINTFEAIQRMPNPVGIQSRTENSVNFGTWMREVSASLNYSGKQEIDGAYAMTDWTLNEKWRLVAGIRREGTYLETVPADDTNPENRGLIDQKDYLPSLSVVYNMGETMNLRFAYGKTIARPTYREMAGVNVFQPFTDEFYSGNPDLKVTRIDNLDLRWEWYPKLGDLIAVSAYYKKLKNPIEVAFDQGFNSPQNLEQGTIWGLELEMRAYLDYLHDSLKNVSVGTNFSWTESEVDIPADELELIRQFDPQAGDTRELFGQSPYLFNFDLSYEQPGWGLSSAITYNVFGERLALVTTGALPDVYEQPRGTLNLFVSKRFGEHWEVKFSANNLLDPDYEESLTANGTPFIYEQRNSGRKFGLSVTYEL